MSAPVKSHEAFGVNSQEQQLLWHDDFLGDQVDDRWSTSGTVAVQDAETGGVIKLTTGAVLNNIARVFWNDIRTLLVSKSVSIEMRAKIEDLTNSSYFLCYLEAASAGLAFARNTDLGHTNWMLYHETLAGAPVYEDSGIAADTDFHNFRIESTPTSVRYFIDDVECSNSPVTANIPTAYLQVVYLIQTKEAAQKDGYLDYVVVRQER